MAITAEHERELATRAKAGDRVAMAELLEAHKGYLSLCARRSGMDYDDAMQEAMIAAMESVRTYDPAKGYRFLTYAGRKVTWVLGRIRETSGLISTPTKQNTVPKLRDKSRRAKRIGSIDAPASGAGSRTWSEILPDDADPAIAAERSEDVRRVRDALDRLPRRQARVVMRRANGEKLAAIGNDLGVCKERVRQIEADAMDRLPGLMIGAA